MHFVAKAELFHNPLFGALIRSYNSIPIQRGVQARSGLRGAEEVLSAGGAVLIFPEGTRTPDGTLQRAEPGLGLVITKTRAPVVPMRIFGAFDAWPIGGKIRLGPRITIVVGEPIHFSDADLERGGRDAYGSLSRRVMDAIAALQLPAAKVDNRVAQQNSASILQQ